MVTTVRLLIGLLLLATAGCSGGSAMADGGRADSSSLDGGAGEGGRPDARAGDAAGPDGAETDSSVPDAGGVDGGCGTAGGHITVVFRVDMNGGLDRNCHPLDPARWLVAGALDDPAKTAFLVGGVHEQTPMCDGSRTSHCLTEAQRTCLSAALGDWAPNIVPMFDDGTHGDVTAGDGVYALALDVPYWDPDDSPDGAGVRFGYKFTWGEGGDPWTGSEEWPGNQRLLEVADVNGDGAVVRQDLFGDETTNKDAANLLTPANGGCGVVVFAAEQAATPEYADCVMDSRENRIDTDGDCTLDTYRPPP